MQQLELLELTKKCTKCNKELAYSCFHKNKSSVGGRRSHCKKCILKNHRTEHVRAIKRAAQLRYSHSEKGKMAYAKLGKIKWLKTKQLKRDKVYILVRRNLHKQPCEVCGSTKVHAHHSDYSKPLEVKWLCPLHHMKEHHG